MDSEQVKQKLLVSLRDLLGGSLAPQQHLALQRWLYAKTEAPAGTGYLLDTDNQLAACGDWCLGDRVEDAFLSGLRLGEPLQQLL